LINFFTPS